MPRTPHDKMAFVMPGFDQLRNREVAEILNFIRNGWGNHGSAISESDVARMRKLVAHKPAHYVPAGKQWTSHPGWLDLSLQSPLSQQR